MYNKYTDFETMLRELYPEMAIFANDERFVIEKSRKEILTYQPDGVIFANLNQIPKALTHINDYDLLRKT